MLLSRRKNQPRGLRSRRCRAGTAGHGRARETFTRSAGDASELAHATANAGRGHSSHRRGQLTVPGRVAQEPGAHLGISPLPPFRDSDATQICSRSHRDLGGDWPGDRGKQITLTRRVSTHEDPLTVRCWEFAEEEIAWNSPDMCKTGQGELEAANQTLMG